MHTCKTAPARSTEKQAARPKHREMRVGWRRKREAYPTGIQAAKKPSPAREDTAVLRMLPRWCATTRSKCHQGNKDKRSYYKMNPKTLKSTPRMIRIFSSKISPLRVDSSEASEIEFRKQHPHKSLFFFSFLLPASQAAPATKITSNRGVALSRQIKYLPTRAR